MWKFWFFLPVSFGLKARIQSYPSTFRVVNSLSENFEFIYTMLFNYITLFFWELLYTQKPLFGKLARCMNRSLAKLVPKPKRWCKWTRTRGKTSLQIQLLMKVFFRFLTHQNTHLLCYNYFSWFLVLPLLSTHTHTNTYLLCAHCTHLPLTVNFLLARMRTNSESHLRRKTESQSLLDVCAFNVFNYI